MAIVGMFARVDAAKRPDALRRLESIPEVEIFEVHDPDKVGLLIEAVSLDAAHACLRDAIEPVDGVLGVWPVYASIEDEEDEMETERTESPAAVPQQENSMDEYNDKAVGHGNNET